MKLLGADVFCSISPCADGTKAAINADLNSSPYMICLPVRVAVKVTGWPIAGAVVDAARVIASLPSYVIAWLVVWLVAWLLPTRTMTAPLVVE